MSRKGKNKRRESKRSFKPEKKKKALRYEDESDFLYKQEKKHKYNKRYLILCEGITEKAYFSGLKHNILLKDKFQAVQIQIVAPSHGQESDTSQILKDNSLKGLVWEAMKRKRKADKEKNPFDEIWVVIDNDERNSFVISAKTVNKSKELLSPIEQAEFESHIDSFFLSKRHYKEFLKHEIRLDTERIETIIQLTDKHTLFEDFEDSDPRMQFFSHGLFTYGQDRKEDIPLERDFDITWKSWIQRAYSCRTFEHWLLLHYELCKIPFTISKEEEITDVNLHDPQNSIHHLWEFAPGFRKGFNKPQKGQFDAYNILKPQPHNPKYETEAEAQAVIDKVNAAIIRSFWLRIEMERELSLQRGNYYEVNPWTDVNYLLSSLLEKEVSYGKLGNYIEFQNLRIRCVLERAKNTVEVSLQNLSPEKRLLINNTNVSSYFNILGIGDDHKHELILAHSIDKTINIPAGEATEVSCRIQFSNVPDAERYLEFHYGGKYLYFFLLPEITNE